MKVFMIVSLLAAVRTAAAFARSLSDAAQGNSTFSWDKNTFYIDGKSYSIIGGQIDPQRVPRAYWPQRLQMAKSMGLNTIFSYLYWQDIEQHPGQFDFSDKNDVAAWFQEVQKAGMKAVLRPGPYVCAERDWGGMPGWLSQISGMKHRSNNGPFLDATSKYLAKVGAQLQPLLISNGGPILMVQIENEYGWAGSDHSYTSKLADILKTNFPNTKLYTNDANNAGALKNGQVPGALAVFDGTDMRNGVNTLRSTITDPSSIGPAMNGEYWIRWFDNWGPKNRHNTYDGDANGMQGRANDLDWMLSNGHHFSIFMFHGGTSFAFGAGSGDTTPRTPFTTSYDYGAPLDETGRPSQIYKYFRTAIGKHVPNIPAIPSTPDLASVPEFPLTPVLSMFTNLPTNPRTSPSPLLMEATNQVFGYILYETTILTPLSGLLQPGSTPARDRIIIYVNHQKKGTIDSIYKTPNAISLSLNKGDTLQLLVENLGRADNGFSDQTKGIAGQVTVGGTKVINWTHYNFPLDATPSLNSSLPILVPSNSPPVWYRGTFSSAVEGMAADTFLRLSGAVKGVVFVNGRNLGRYWVVGPQVEVFVPGAYVRRGAGNVVEVLELEPGTANMSAKGVGQRTWANRGDPDCSGCL